MAENNARPSFEDWMDTKIQSRPGNELVRGNTLYYDLKANLAIFQEALRTMAKEKSGAFSAESEDFKEFQ